MTGPSLGEMLYALETTKCGIVFRIRPQESPGKCNVDLGIDNDSFDGQMHIQSSMAHAIQVAYEDWKKQL